MQKGPLGVANGGQMGAHFFKSPLSQLGLFFLFHPFLWFPYLNYFLLLCFNLYNVNVELAKVHLICIVKISKIPKMFSRPSCLRYK